VSPRGCVLWLLTFGAFIVLVLWFALPPVAGGLVTAALGAAGFHGADTRVEVGADPPLKLLLLKADRVHVQSTEASILNVDADSVDVLLRNVSIQDRTFESIEGTLSGVRFTPDQGPPFTARTVQLTGPAEAAKATLSVDQASVQALVATAVADATGQQVSRVALAAPDRVSVVVAGTTASGRLAIDTAGQLVVIPASGRSIPLVGTGSGTRLRLQSVQVVDQGLELSGVMDLRADAGP
jgi:hypothetical protein